MSDFLDVKPGDTVRRLLAGTVPMSLQVSKVDEQFIYCGDWKFDRKHGYEVDEDLGWGIPRQNGEPMTTGSYLLKTKCKKCDGTGYYKREWGRSLIPHPCNECQNDK